VPTEKGPDKNVRASRAAVYKKPELRGVGMHGVEHQKKQRSPNNVGGPLGL